MFAILRFKKLHRKNGWYSLGGSAKHNFREQPTPNADPNRTPLNKTNGGQSSIEVVKMLNDRLATVPIVRKNAVLAVEYFIGMSPGFKDGGDIEGYFDKAEEWLRAKHGTDNVLSITRQYDETTPHICAYVVPIDTKGRLNATAFYDGSKALSAMQTDFAEVCGKPFGLIRGVERSGATHQEVRIFYAKMLESVSAPAKLPPAPVPTFAEKVAEGLGFDTAHTAAAAKHLQLKRKARDQAKAHDAAIKAKAKQFDIDKRNKGLVMAKIEELRATATLARQLPLSDVFTRLGAIPDPSDRKNWRTMTGERLSVDGSKFYDHTLTKGGAGAINLVMHLTGDNYKGAVSWLTKEFGVGAVVSESLAQEKQKIEKIASAPPSYNHTTFHNPDPKTWETVRNYLINTRGLNAERIDLIHNNGYIYSDKYNNVVFSLGGGKGISLRGTGPQKFHGIRGEKIPFALGPTDKENKKVAFVESPIDALSLRDLGFNGRIVAMLGHNDTLAAAKADAYRAQGLTVCAAFDNDKAGEAMTRSLGECERMTPRGKDWNEDLLMSLERERQALAVKPKRPSGPVLG